MLYKCKLKPSNRLQCLRILREQGFTFEGAKNAIADSITLTDTAKQRLGNALGNYGAFEVLEEVLEEEMPFEDTSEYWETKKRQFAEADAWRSTLGEKEKQYIEWLMPGPACG